MTDNRSRRDNDVRKRSCKGIRRREEEEEKEEEEEEEDEEEEEEEEEGEKEQKRRRGTEKEVGEREGVRFNRSGPY